jgi:hypothetical protein
MVGGGESVDQGGGDHRVAKDLAHCSKPRLEVTMIEPLWVRKVGLG